MRLTTTKLTVAGVALVLAACSHLQSTPPDPNPMPADSPKGPGLFSGQSGNILDAFRSKPTESDQAGGHIGVSIYLWRAALETVNFMPLATADSNGGIIITDWYTDPATPTERVKLNILITGKTIRPDAVHVSLFKQKQVKGTWADEPASTTTGHQLEDTILTRARALRIQARAK